MKKFGQFLETAMTRDQIIKSQTILRSEMDALKREENGLSWDSKDLPRREEIFNKLKTLNAEFKVLANQRVAH